MYRSRVLLEDDGIYQADEGEMNYVLLHVVDTMDPDEVNVTKSPDEQVEPAPNTQKGKPTFDKLEKPGI